MEMQEDTETLLVFLSSLLDPQDIPDQMSLLDALVKSNGDIHKAAQLLKSRKHIQPNMKNPKRKRTTSLDEWLATSTNTQPRAGPSSSRNTSTSQKTVPKRKTVVHSQPDTLAGIQAGSSTSPVNQPTISSSSNVKLVSNQELMTILRPHSSGSPDKHISPPKYPPLSLASPLLVSQHTPCTLHPGILPPELACRLFYTMIHESQTWSRNKWWLFDKVVESPHRTSFYVRNSDDDDNMQEAAQFWYNGRQTEAPSHFPEFMEEACSYIERVVNSEMRKRKRFPLEWGGDSANDGDDAILWRANVAASNRYEGGKENVGFHSDQLTNLGPYPTIASLSLGTTRTFRLREVIPTDDKNARNARTFNIPLVHNSLVIMHASTQEVFKHAIPPQRAIDVFHPPFPPPASLASLHESITDRGSSDIPSFNARINITFRFYRPDFRSSTTPRCRCDVPCILRPDMKNRYTTLDVNGPNGNASSKDIVAKYWWTCYAGVQNDGKGCGFWKVMDMKAEGRGPCVGDQSDKV